MGNIFYSTSFGGSFHETEMMRLRKAQRQFGMVDVVLNPTGFGSKGAGYHRHVNTDFWIINATGMRTGYVKQLCTTLITLRLAEAAQRTCKNESGVSPAALDALRGIFNGFRLYFQGIVVCLPTYMFIAVGAVQHTRAFLFISQHT